MSELLTVENFVALLTLTTLEVVLGIDNIIFIAILTNKLEPAVQDKARRIGLVLAMLMRIVLLLGLGWIMKLTHPLFSIFSHGFSGKDMILLVGGLFLIAKSTYEIHDRIEGSADHGLSQKKIASFRGAIMQIVALDLVFSLDSVITAVGMAQHIAIMITAVVIAVGIMMIFAAPISRFVEHRPTLKMLALAFLLLIGVMLLAEGFGKHVSKGYIYFAMAFSLGVEMLNMKARAAHARPQ